MKTVLTLVGALASIAQIGWGATICSPGTLASYISLGPAGCTIGTETVGSFATLIGSATPIAPGSVQVTPSGGSLNPALTFVTNINTSDTLEAIFSYRIFGNPLTASSITLSNASATGNGTVSEVQNLCGAGMFGPDGVSGCSGSTFGPNITNTSSDLTSLSSFPKQSFLTVSDDIVLDGGNPGTATGGRFVDQFTAVPEPGTIVITTLGIALLFTLKLKSKETL